MAGRGATVALLCAALAAAPGARAQGAGQERDRVRLLLLVHHEAPTARALEGAAADPVAVLCEVARDPGEAELVRRRALAVLGGLDDPRSERLVREALSSWPESALRRAAARAASRLLAGRPAELVPLLATLAASPDPADREVAVWLLASEGSEASQRVLARRRTVERHRAVVDALTRVRRPGR